MQLSMQFSMHLKNLIEPCLWLAVDVGFSQGTVSGRNAAEFWRAAIKKGLLASRPAEAMQLLEPLKTKGLATNVDCPGLVVECQERLQGVRVLLKFLGHAHRFAPLCLLALESELRQGIGQPMVLGSIVGISAWHKGEWVGIAMPLTAAELDKWRDDPAVLAEPDSPCLPVAQYGVLRLTTRTRWVLRQQETSEKHVPNLAEVIALVAQRMERFMLAWGGTPNPVLTATLEVALRLAVGFMPTEQCWQATKRMVAGRYPSHGYVGQLNFVGEVSDELLYLLYAGSFLHVGQQTAIGLGGYAVEFEAAPMPTPMPTPIKPQQ